MRKSRNIFECLGNPTIQIAWDLLSRLGATSDLIWLKEECLPIEALCRKLEPGKHAFLVPIQFVGGPPKGQGLIQEYKGTLYTFLLDRILYCIAEIGLESTKDMLGIPRRPQWPF
jgi:hypothetical protein